MFCSLNQAKKMLISLADFARTGGKNSRMKELEKNSGLKELKRTLVWNNCKKDSGLKELKKFWFERTGKQNSGLK